MAVDTIFLCFCEDSDRNDGVNRPYFMSTGLMVTVSVWLTCVRNCRLMQGCVKIARSLRFPPWFQDQIWFDFSILQQFLSDSEAALKAEKERKYAKKVTLIEIVDFSFLYCSHMHCVESCDKVWLKGIIYTLYHLGTEASELGRKREKAWGCGAGCGGGGLASSVWLTSAINVIKTKY